MIFFTIDTSSINTFINSLIAVYGLDEKSHYDNVEYIYLSNGTDVTVDCVTGEVTIEE